MLKNLPRKEFYQYVAAVGIAFIGLLFIILGVIADNLPVGNPLDKAQGSFPWRYLGMIILAIGVIYFLIVLLVFAKKVDRTADREARRKQRLSAMMSDLDKKEDTIVVNDGKIVEEKKPVEEEKEPEVKLEATKPVENQTEPKVESTPTEPKIDNNSNNPEVK